MTERERAEIGREDAGHLPWPHHQVLSATRQGSHSWWGWAIGQGAEGGRCLVERVSRLARWSSCALYMGRRIQHWGYQAGPDGLAPAPVPET